MRYAAGLSVPDPFILLDTGRKRTLLLSSLEYGRAKRALGRKKRYEIVLLDRYYERVKEKLKARKGQKIRKGGVLALIAAAYLKGRKVRSVVMPARAQAIHVEQLREAGIRVALAATPYPGRAVKTEKEIKEILKVRDATVTAMRRCIMIIRKSGTERRGGGEGKGNGYLYYEGKRVTSGLLRQEARHVLLAHGCEAPELIASHGRQTAYPHDMGSGPIRAGEPVILDFFPRSTESGYWFDMTRTVVKGRPSAGFRKLYAAVQEAQDAALSKVRAGVRAGTVHAAAADVFRKRGYATTEEEGYIHSTGHGVGLEIHEAPSLHAGNTEVLKAGMVVTVEPGLYYHKLGGVRLENTVLVTTTGHRDLTRMRRGMR